MAYYYKGMAISVKKQKVTKPKVSRLDNAKVLVDGVTRLEGNSYSVRSQSHPETSYTVYMFGDKFGCDCADNMCRNVDCKHILAVKLYNGDYQIEQAIEQRIREYTQMGAL